MPLLLLLLLLGKYTRPQLHALYGRLKLPLAALWPQCPQVPISTFARCDVIPSRMLTYSWLLFFCICRSFLPSVVFNRPDFQSKLFCCMLTVYRPDGVEQHLHSGAVAEPVQPRCFLLTRCMICKVLLWRLVGDVIRVCPSPQVCSAHKTAAIIRECLLMQWSEVAEQCLWLCLQGPTATLRLKSTPNPLPETPHTYTVLLWVRVFVNYGWTKVVKNIFSCFLVTNEIGAVVQ